MNINLSELESMLDDAAALGDVEELKDIAWALHNMASAASSRARAVEMRLEGDVECALSCESNSEFALHRAHNRPAGC